MIKGIQQQSAAEARIVTEQKDYLQLPNGELVEGRFDKIEYTDEGKDIFKVTEDGNTQNMRLVGKKLTKMP